MIEAYAFLAMFTVQILAMSVLSPAWFTRYVRLKATSSSIERLAQMYPGVDLDRARDRFLPRYRLVNAGIAVVGLLLLALLFNYMRRPDWDDGPVEALVGGYFLLQALPMCLIAWLSFRFKKKVLEESLPEGKRKATLQRRRLFDFVSPFAVILAVLGYFVIVAFAIYLEQHPFPGFAGAFVNIGIVTLVYASQAFGAYKLLYGKKINALETDAESVRRLGLGVKACVYICIVIAVFYSLNFTLVLLDLQRWEPFAISAFLVISALLSLMCLTAPPRRPEAEGLGSNPVPRPRE